MLYDIALRIEYRYEYPAGASRHIVRLHPASLPSEQRLVACSVTAEPKPDEWIERIDFFGNRIAEAAFFRRHDRLGFALHGRVEKLEETPPLDTSPGLDNLSRQIGAERSMGGLSPVHYTGTSRRVDLHPEVTRYAEKAVRGSSSAKRMVEAFGNAIHRDMKYDPEATTVETPLIEAFRGRHGVCQDFAHIMIAGLRGLGIPAGYVSGLLRTTPPPGKARLEGADAMHAWIMAWCGTDMGWLEFDPTNAVFAGKDHIVIARGRDYFDVSPVRGIMRSHGDHTSKHTVDVIPVETR